MISPQYQALFFAVVTEVVLVFAFAAPVSASPVDNLTQRINDKVHQTTQEVNDTTNQVLQPIAKLLNRSPGRVASLVNEVTSGTANAVTGRLNNTIKNLPTGPLGFLNQPNGQTPNNSAGTPDSIFKARVNSPTAKITTQQLLTAATPEPAPSSSTKRPNRGIKRFAFPLALSVLLIAIAVSEFLTDRRNPKLQRIEEDQEVAFS